MKCPCRIDGGVSFYVCGFNNCEGGKLKPQRLLQTKKMEEKNDNVFIYDILNLVRFAKANILRFSYTERLSLHFLQTRTAEVY